MAENEPPAFPRPRRTRHHLGAGTTYLPSNTLPSSPTLRSHISHILTHGYVILPNLFTPAQTAAATAELVRLEAAGAGPASQAGRNHFEGRRTRRVYALADKSRVFDQFATHEAVLALNDYFLEENYLLTAFHTVNVLPGEQSQALHTDDGLVDLPRPRPLMGIGTMIALDDFTATNGATVVIPGSHLWPDSRHPTRAETVPIVMPAGSMVYFLNTLWHGAGTNASAAARRSLTVQYCQPWMRPLENMMVATGWEELERIPARLRALLGYSSHVFAGHVDGVSPRRGVEMRKARLVEWARRGWVKEGGEGSRGVKL